VLIRREDGKEIEMAKSSIKAFRDYLEAFISRGEGWVSGIELFRGLSKQYSSQSSIQQEEQQQRRSKK
jgi:hypothetical protein